VLNVVLNDPPGAIVPELKVVPLFAVAVCAIESLFTHMTESPTLTVTGLGTNAVVVSDIAPTGMVTFVVAAEEVPVDPVVVVVPVVLGAGDGVELLLLHAAAAMRRAATSTRRITIRSPSGNVFAPCLANALPLVRAT
jgi:hypothetical protein